MSTLFIGVAIMAKIDSDKWQGGGFVIVVITLEYGIQNLRYRVFLKIKMQLFLHIKTMIQPFVHNRILFALIFASVRRWHNTFSGLDDMNLSF
jgi:hypothetical protein